MYKALLPIPIALIISSVLLGAINNVSAADRFCPISDKTDEDLIKISADRIVTDANQRVRLSGKVQAVQGNNHIHAKQIQYNHKKKLLQAKDNVLYTNCAAASPDWFIAADRISLSQNQAAAKSAWLVFKNTPLLYFPFYRVLLNKQRKSGFLTPDIGINSRRGVEIGVPYYLNIAPNQDATLTPRYLSKRGLQLDSEYRYLTHWGSGKLEADWIDDHEYDDDRYSYKIGHHYDNTDNLRFDIRYQRVSDTDYTDDISKSFHFTSQNYLRSYATLDYVWNGWRLNMLADTLQTTDEDARDEERPYEIRPAITVAKNFYPAGTGLAVNMHTQWTHFDYRGTNTDDNTDGQRFDNQLGVSWSYKRPGFHLTPAANIRYTGYDLDGDDPRKISRTVPSFSVRSGLMFEKDDDSGGYQHILEPELFYLHVPHRNQDDIPVFDTDRTEFRYSELFSENRFNSIDRIGDADQLTLALTKRILHRPSGKEVFRASLGQIYYFRKNRVTLSDEEAANHSSSDIAGELSFNLNDKFAWYSSLVWDDNDSQLSRLVNRVSLNAGKNRLINLYHRYRRDEYEQFGFNFRVPISDRWHLISGWSYDIQSSEDLEILGGLEYQSCCWGLRLIGQRILKDIDGPDLTIQDGDLDYDTTFKIELNFRGLGSITNSSDKLLEKSIFNYKTP